MENNWQFGHVGVVVKDLAKFMAYHQPLGIIKFEPGITEPRPHVDEYIHGKDIGPFSMYRKLVKLGPITLEIHQPISGDSLQMEFMKERGEGLHHIAFWVEDLAAERAKLVKQGIPIALERKDGQNVTYFDITKFGNIYIELNQIRPDSDVKIALNDWTLRHVGVVVKDMVKTLDFFESTGLFKFEPGSSPIIARDEYMWGKMEHFTVRSGKLVQLGNAFLELIEPVEGNSIHKEFLQQYGEGLHHISFTVNDLEKERNILVSKGIPIAIIREDKARFSYFDLRKHSNLLVS